MTSLILFRHAKAVPAGPGGDHIRALAAEGQRAAPLIGAELKRMGLNPEIILVSSAARTQETYTLAAAAGAFGAATVEDELYLASAGSILKRIRKVPPRTKSVMIIGHNPGLAELASRLADPEESDSRARARARARFPTATCVVLNVLTPWSEIEDGDCALTHYFTPADMGLTDED